MKIGKFKLRGNNSVCAGAFQLLRGRAPAQLRGNIGYNVTKQYLYQVPYAKHIIIIIIIIINFTNYEVLDVVPVLYPSK
jgi:hypothetical protein